MSCCYRSDCSWLSYVGSGKRVIDLHLACASWTGSTRCSAPEYYRSLSEQDKADLVTALSADLGHVGNEANKYTMLSYFYKADPDYGSRLAAATKADVTRVKAAAAKLTD